MVVGSPQFKFIDLKWGLYLDLELYLVKNNTPRLYKNNQHFHLLPSSSHGSPSPSVVTMNIHPCLPERGNHCIRAYL